MKTNAANLESRFWRLPCPCVLERRPIGNGFRWMAIIHATPPVAGVGATRSDAISSAMNQVTRCFYDGGAGRCVLPLGHDGPHQAPEAKP